MENQKSTSTQIMLNYGLMLGVASILIAVANFAFGNVYKPHWIISVISGLATVVIIVFGLKTLKQNNNGYLSLGESLKTGLGIALISGIVYVIYNFVFTSFIEPDYFTNLANVQEAAIVESYPNMSDEQLENAMEMSKKFSGIGMISAIIVIMSLFFGFIVSLIAGLVMKKTQEEEE
jgi:putative effector of murein hydrolase